MKLVLAFLAMSLAARAGDIEAAVKHFYVDLKPLSIRGTVDGDDVDHCSEALTPSYKGAIDAARKGVQAWRDAAKRDPERFRNLKLPLTEGPIFTWVYEGGDFARIESVTEAGDRGYARVRIHLELAGEKDDWSDLVILHRVGGQWLIDDILSGIDDSEPVSMRDRLVIPPTEDAIQAVPSGDTKPPK
jgi:hypothetical protein